MARVLAGIGKFLSNEVAGVPTFHLYRGGAIDPTHSKVRIPSEHDCTRGPSDPQNRMGLNLSGTYAPRAMDAPDPDAAPVLSGRERRALRRLAHGLRPVVQVGGSGVTDGVIAALDVALRDHELVKLEIAHEREERALLADEVASRTGSAVAGLIGKMAILYRPARDPDKRRIELSAEARA
jgi:RNA-binding protein